MDINIKVMSEEAYSTLQKNAEEVYEMIISHPSDSTWLKDYLGFEPFEIKKYIIKDFELKYDGYYPNVAYDNAIILYENLNQLPRYILCDAKFWAWIVFEKAYKQSIISSDLSKSVVKNLWLPNTSRRFLMLGVISRYFFMVEASIDHTLENKYELLEYLISNGELYRLISYANIGMIKNVTIGIIRAMKDFSDRNYISINKPNTRQIFKNCSKLSSVRLIDLMSQQEIYEYLYSKIETIMDDNRIEIDFDF